jgi:hypothetical protein
MKYWLTTIDQVTQAVLADFGNLNAEQLNRKPDDATWSIAQNIDHLIVINTSYFPVIESLRMGTYRTPWLGKIGFLVSFFGNTVLKAVQPDRKRKMKTFPIWEPTQSDFKPEILIRFQNHQSRLKEFIQGSEDLLEKDVVISSPANKNIVYKLEKAFDIIVTHEQRHLAQAKEVYQMIKSEQR